MEVKPYTVACSDAIELLHNHKADLCFGSPPYIDRRLYGRDDVARGPVEWVNWMLDVSEAALACAPHVIWVVANGRSGGNYKPAVEGLSWNWFLRGHHQDDMAVWHKNGFPGTGGRWLRRDHEFILSFKRPPAGKKKGENAASSHYFSNPLANGTPPKYNRGGRFSNRSRDGTRQDGAYPQVKLKHPGSVNYFPVGGNMMGHELAYENEAPFPLSLATFFLRGWAPPGGTVLDCFCGSSTTGHAAVSLGMRYIGGDIRQSQVDLSMRRLNQVWEEKKGG